MITGAVADCERVLDGFWGQPVNAVTALVFAVAGTWLIRSRPDRLVVGLALIGVGVGSFLFHGPMPPGSQWAHDVTLGWLLAVVGLTALDRPRLVWPALGVLGVAIALAPGWADPLAAAGTVFVLAAFLSRPGWRSAVPAMLLLGFAAIVGRLSATGGPLCRPESLLQGHAFWHLAAAIAVTWWALLPAPRLASVARSADTRV
ncbi:MAG TPA: hypothetical protein VK969_11125 [Acidimicrobiia bacterium]|nr:hypothetical protein [Acidimicrobiia bacterium]